MCSKTVAGLCMTLSVWGCIQLLVMSYCYREHAAVLLEYLPIEHKGHESNTEEYFTAVDAGYAQNARTCLITAIAYLVVFILSLHSYCASRRRQKLQEIQESTEK